MTRDEVLAVLDALLRRKGARALTNLTWTELNAAREVIANALEDQTRYRHMRSSGVWLDPDSVYLDGAQLDAAIDAARLGGEKV